MAVMTCLACRGLAEPPYTRVEDGRGRPTGLVVCVRCLDGGGVSDADEVEELFPVELGGEG
jgi:hypothetical protein